MADSQAGSQADSQQQKSPVAASRVLLNSSFEVLIKGGGIILIILYFFGVIAINSVLRSIGVYDFSPFSYRFTLTGLVVMSPIMLAIWLVWIAQTVPCLRNARREGALKSIKHSYGWKLIFSLWAFVVMCMFAFRINDAEIKALTYIIGTILVVSVCGCWAILMELHRRSDDKSGAQNVDPDEERKKWGKVGGLLLVSFAFSMIYTSKMAHIALPMVPQQFGGSKKSHIALIGRNSLDRCADKIDAVSAGMGHSMDAELLWDAGEYIVVQFDSPSKIVRLDTDQFCGWIVTVQD